MSEKDNTTDFEAALVQLEELVSKMEQGQLSLEQSLEAFEAGVKLTRTCQDTLKNAEQRVEQLLKQGDELELKSFNPKTES